MAAAQIRASANKDAELITATALATAEQISTTARNPVDTAARRSTNGRKPLTDNQVALRAQSLEEEALSLSLSHLYLIHSVPPSISSFFCLPLAGWVLVNETKSAEMHQKGHCSQ